MKERFRMLAVAVVVFLLTVPIVEADSVTASRLLAQAQTPAGPGENQLASRGQTLYVPAYSHIYYFTRKRRYNLAATLSIRNTDLTRPITITSVRYYDTDGRLLKKYVENPLQLAPLASTDFVVEERDTSGGSGANFIVEWTANTRVSAPVVETVMISSGTQGISFVSPARVIESSNP